MKIRIGTLLAIIFCIVVISCEDDDGTNTDIGIVNFSHDKLTEVENATIPLGVNIGIENYNHSGGVISVSITGGNYGVDYETSGGSASFDIEIKENTLLTKFSIIPIDNDELDGTKELNVSISSVSGSLELGEKTNLIFTILDDDKPVVGAASFENENYSIVENSVEPLAVKLVLDEASTYGGTVSIRTAGTAVLGTDYLIDEVEAANFEVQLPPGASEVSFSIIPIDNSEYAEDKTIDFEILEVSGGLSLGALLHTIVTIENDDAPVFPVVELEQAEMAINEADGTLTFKVLLSKVLETEGLITLDVSGTAKLGEDFTIDEKNIEPIEVVLPVNQLETSFTVEITDDTTTEELETAIITISSASEGIEIGANNEITISIEDNDPAFIPFTYLQDFESINDITAAGLENILINQDPGFPAGDILKYNTKAGEYADAADENSSSDAGMQCFHKLANGAGILDNMVVTPMMDTSGPLEISIDVSYVTGLDKNNTTVTYYYSETYNASGTFNTSDWTVLGTDNAQDMDAAGYARKEWKRNKFNVEVAGPLYIAIRIYQEFDATYVTSQWRIDNIKVSNE